jgi:hypothetical protein
MITCKREEFIAALNSLQPTSNGTSIKKKNKFTVITLVKTYNKDSNSSAILGIRQEDSKYTQLKSSIDKLKNTPVLKGKIRHTLKGTYGEMFSFSQEFYSTIKSFLSSEAIPFIEIEEIEKIRDDENSI